MDKIPQQRLLALIERYDLTPGNILLVFFSFWITALAFRGVIFWLIYHGSIPAVFVKGYEIHHFVFGFFLLVAGLILFSREILSRYIPLTLIGFSLALIFDEFLYWTRGHFNYWSIINLIATVIIGCVILAVHLYAKRESGGRLSKKRLIMTLSAIIIFSGCLYFIFHLDSLLSGGYIQARPWPQDYSETTAK